MAIVFRKVSSSGSDPALAVPTREPCDDRRACERVLLDFLWSLRMGEAETGAILWPSSAVLASLAAAPPASLIDVFGLCLDDLLGEIGPNGGDWRRLTLTSAVFGMALAAYNALCDRSPEDDIAISDTLTLVYSLPPAMSVADALGYHAVLRHVVNRIDGAAPHRDAILRPLVDLCPLTTILALDRIAPAPLAGLAAELLPGWTIEPVARSPWTSADIWLDAVGALADAPFIGRCVRRCWLALPRSAVACRNLGLVLEALRQHGRHREFLYAFYEAYEYFHAIRPASDPSRRHWAVLDDVARLLAAADTSAPHRALRLQQRARSRFLFFHPLLQLIISERGIPSTLNHLRDLPIAAAHYIDLTAATSRPARMDMSDIEFGEDAP
ncbi:hypothetical protein M2352_003367 [Azospirillum fermentarium]|uniref:hypothetical protein n=1 Tax=Azospirillum fermentarium TaxID=1233114 RepID=UPI002225C739|nr:hypothetical protein [Azospirillum fermentarium]MCW2247733.1 hypothetical protein [Azospirillum fermentarium]